MVATQKFSKAKKALMMRVLMNCYHQGAPEMLLSFLPKEEADAVLEASTPCNKPATALLHPEQFLGDDIHYSWLQQTLSGFQPSLQPFLISSLSQSSAFALSKLMGQPLVTSLSPIAKKFYLSMLCRQFMKESILPLAFLPETPLAELTKLTKPEFIELIDFLGLYDLAEEIRHIIDKNILKSIYECLSAKKQHFLRNCLHQKEKLKSAKIGLVNWKGDAHQLARLLHRRGLLRLSYALRGQHRDFVWHLVHRLDVGRGRLIADQFSSKELPGVTAFLLQQVLKTQTFLTRTRPS